MKHTTYQKQAVKADSDVSHVETIEYPMGYTDPHRVALEDNPEHVEKLTLSIALSALFLGTSISH